MPFKLSFFISQRFVTQKTYKGYAKNEELFPWVWQMNRFEKNKEEEREKIIKRVQEM